LHFGTSDGLSPVVQSPQPEGPEPFNSLAMQFVGAAQRLLVQLSDLQSRFTPQPVPVAHCIQDASTFEVQPCAQLPPQSGPVSVPFLNVSVQAGVAHLPLELHQPLAQSRSLVQDFVSMHFVGHVPPQSTSDSIPFLIESPQEGVAHRPLLLHQALRQSVFAVQIWPSLQPVVLVLQLGPPQSRSVSC
jgi:hypothetical protein